MSSREDKQLQLESAKKNLNAYKNQISVLEHQIAQLEKELDELDYEKQLANALFYMCSQNVARNDTAYNMWCSELEAGGKNLWKGEIHATFLAMAGEILARSASTESGEKLVVDIFRTATDIMESFDL